MTTQNNYGLNKMSEIKRAIWDARNDATDIRQSLAKTQSNSAFSWHVRALTTAERDTLYPTPYNGLTIYNTTTNTYQVYSDGVWVSMNGQGWVFVSDYASLNAAVAAIGADEVTLVMDVDTTITANLVISTNISLLWIANSVVTGAFTLNIGKQANDPLWRIYDGPTVTFIDNAVSNYRPIWWGADDTAIQSAATACYSGGGGTVVLGVGSFAIDSIIVFRAGVKLLGQGILNTVLNVSGAGMLKWDEDSFADINGGGMESMTCNFNNIAIGIQVRNVCGWYCHFCQLAGIGSRVDTMIKLIGCSFHCEISNNRIEDFKQIGIDFDDDPTFPVGGGVYPNGTIISHNDIAGRIDDDGTASIGIRIVGGSGYQLTSVKIVDNWFEHASAAPLFTLSYGPAVVAQYTEGLIIDRNFIGASYYIYPNVVAGYASVDGDQITIGAGCYDTKITNNIITMTGGSGIRITDDGLTSAARTIIANNSFYIDWGVDIIVLDNTIASSISNNTMFLIQGGFQGISGSAVSIESASTQIPIVGNIIRAQGTGYRIIRTTDASNQLAQWNIHRMVADTYYVDLTDAAGTRTIDVYNDIGKAAVALVATGSLLGDGIVAMVEANGSGYYGTVEVAYTVDDTAIVIDVEGGTGILIENGCTDISITTNSLLYMGIGIDCLSNASARRVSVDATLFNQCAEAVSVVSPVDISFFNCIGLPGGLFITGSGDLLVGGNIYTANEVAILADNINLELGAAGDVAMYYDGTNANIDTDLVAASDLTIDCGAAKTVVLETPVYKDINLGAAILSLPVATQPDEVQLLNEAGAGTGIYTWGFAVDELVSGVFEIQHDYKEGTDLTFHVHWSGNDAPTGTDYVKWELAYTITRDNNTINAVTTIVKETAYDTQYEMVRSDFPAIVGSTGGVDGGNIHIGDQFYFKLKRITADGDAYAGDALVATVGVHYQIDTIGSRSIAAK